MSLTSKATTGVVSNGLAAVITAVLQALQLIFLARLLTPEAFGLMAMLEIVLGFARLYADFGVSNAIIFREKPSRDELSSLYWLNIIVGLIILIILIEAAPLISSLFNEPRLDGLLHWVAVLPFIASFGQQFQFLLQKELRFRELAQIEVVSVIVGFVIAIISGLTGQGVLALIWAELGRVSIKASMLAFIGWLQSPPSLHFELKDLRGYLSFGLYQMGEKSINYFNQRVDQLLLGTLLNAQTLGYYNLAFNIVITPYMRINPILTKVAFPVFAKVQNEASRLRRGYLRLIEIVSLINYPLLLGIIAIAPTVIPLIFGTNWEPAIPLVQGLAFVALVRLTMNPVGSLLLAKGQADKGFWWNVIVFCVQSPMIYIGARFGGSIGLIYTLIFVQYSLFFVAYLYLLRPIVGNCFGSYMQSMWPAIWMSTVMGISVSLIPLLGLSILQTLSIQILLGIFIYLILNWGIYRENLLTMFHLLFDRMETSKASN